MSLRPDRPWTLMVLVLISLTACDLFVSAEARVDRAAEHVAMGDYRAAMIELKNALQEEPENVDARLMLSRVSLQLGDLEAAHKELERAVEAGATPDRVGVLRYDLLVARREFDDIMTFLAADTTIDPADRLYYTAVAELGDGNVGAAREAADALVSHDPEDPRGHIQMAEVYAAERQLDSALAAIRKALELDPDNRIAQWTEGRLLVVAGRWEDAEQPLLEATADGDDALDAMTLAAALAALTEAHLGQRDIAAATQTVERLARIAPGAPGTRLLTARLALENDRPGDAVGELQPVVQALPDYMPAQIVYGAALIAQGSLAQAEAHLERVLTRNPESADARRMLGEVQLRQGRADEAVNVLLPLAGGDSDTRTDLLMGQALMRSGSRDEAIELLERGAASQPDNATLQSELAAAYIEIGRVDDAIKLLERLPQGSADGRRDSLLVLAYATQGKGRGRAEVEKLAEEHPQDARILNLVGSYMLRNGDTQAARQYLEKAAEVAPNDAASWLALSNLEYRTGHRDAARTALKRAQAVDAGNEAAALGLARIELDENSRTAAIEILDRAVAQNSEAIRARLVLAQLQLQGDNAARARELFDEAIAASEDRTSTLIAIAGVQLRSERAADAVETLKPVVASEPKNPEALYALGLAQAATQDPAAARRSFESALAERPKWIQPAMVLVMMDMQAGRGEDALGRARKTRAADPDNVTAIALEADVLANLKRTDEALKAYADAQAAAPTRQVAERMLQLRASRGDRSPEQPLVDYIAQRPDDLLARRKLAEHYQTEGEKPAAIAQYEKLVEMAPNDAASTNNLAWLYYEVGDERAEATARRASEISPANGAITDTLGWILVEKGEVDEGTELLRRAAKQAQNLPDVRYHLAAALARGGNREEALTILRELLDGKAAFPSRAQAETLLKELSS